MNPAEATMDVTRTPSGNQPPLVAICTPVYNGERYLAEAMDSVQAQTYPNLVHCVSDNASTDGTAAILERYRSGRVPLIVSRGSETVPVIPNWNRAFALAPPEAGYIRILCADDRLEPACVEKMAAVLERHPRAGVANAAEWYGDRIEDWNWPKDRDFLEGSDAVRAYFRSDIGITAPQTMFRAGDVRAASGRFFDETLLNGDMDAWLRVVSGSAAAYVHEPLAFTRLHDQSMTTKTQHELKYHWPEWVAYLRRYGPAVFSEREMADIHHRFRRRYTRQMMRWAARRRMDLVRYHAVSLARFGQKVTAKDVAEAVATWPLEKIGLVKPWSGYPY